MDSMDDHRYGFDATFVSEVAEYLKCVICHLVLRKPLLIIKCGHKFCEPCFNRIKYYSENSNTQLLCPVDREIIDVNKVFEDNGINRVIGDLAVKCVNNVTGCIWTGELRNLQVHEEQCEHRVEQKMCDQPTVGASSMLLKELCQRMSKCEDSLVEKEKDIAHLKFNLQEVKKKFDEKLVEIDLLKNENKKMEHELKIINNKNMEFKQVEVKIENLSLKNILVEQKVDSFENQLLVSKKQLEDNQIEVAAIKNDIEGVKDMMENQKVEITAVKGEVKDVKSMLDNQQMDIATVNEEIGTFKNSLHETIKNRTSELSKELQAKINDDAKKQKGSLGNSSNKQFDKINKLSCRVTNVEKEVESKRYEILNDKTAQNKLKDSQEEMEVLKSQKSRYKSGGGNFGGRDYCQAGNRGGGGGVGNNFYNAPMQHGGIRFVFGGYNKPQPPQVDQQSFHAVGNVRSGRGGNRGGGDGGHRNNSNDWWDQ